MKKIFLMIILSFFLFNVPGIGEEIQKVEVTSKVANIRSGPALDSKVIGKGFLGDLFVLLGTEGSWYKIELPADEEGVKKVGYIYKSISKIEGDKKRKESPPPTPVKAEKEKKVVEKEKILLKEEKEKEKVEKEKLKAAKKAEKKKIKAAKKAEREKKKAEKKAEKERIKAEKKKSDIKIVKKKKDNQDILFKGFYLKAGYMTKPKVDSLGDKWVFDLGFDTPIGKYAAWGLEFQPYFRSFSADAIDFTAYNLVTNIFLNVKGGINLGVLWDKIDFITLFLGGGPGVSLGYLYTDYNGITGSQFDVMFAWHIVYGAEFKLGKMNIIVEFQSNKVINTEIDPSTQSSNYFLFGLRF